MGEGVVRGANEGTPRQLPGIGKAPHAGHNALGVGDRHLSTQIVCEGVLLAGLGSGLRSVLAFLARACTAGRKGYKGHGKQGYQGHVHKEVAAGGGLIHGRRSSFL